MRKIMLILTMSVLSVSLMGAMGVKSSHDEDTGNKIVKIMVNFSPLYGGGNIEFYNDTYQRLSSSLMLKLANAKEIPLLSLYKEALPEGEYTVEVYDNNVIVQTYTVLNSGDVFDKTNNRYLRCDALSDIYRIFVHVLLQERIDKNL